MELLYRRYPHIQHYNKRDHNYESANIIITAYTWFLTALLFLASLAAALIYNETEFWANLIRIFTSPARLVTDYFALGGPGSSFFNAALCSLACHLFIRPNHVKANASTFAGYILVVAHCFYGLNFLSMWLPIFGVMVYCAVTKRPFRENVHIAFFSTALGPFISEFLFRYTLGDSFDAAHPQVTVAGIILAILFGLISGFVVPALLPGTTSMHRGYNMYKAGLAIGIMGIFVYSFMYRSLGLTVPEMMSIDNSVYYARPHGYRGLVNVFFLVFFGLTLFFGWLLNYRSFRGYKGLLRCTGHGVDFLDKFGMPLCLINTGIYGLFFLAYINIVIVLPDIFPFLPAGVGFTGSTTGAVFAALTFTADGQQPRTVASVLLGFAMHAVVVCAVCLLCGLPVPWTLSTQSYINAVAFATGLCPFAGKYGWKVGALAGFLCAMICTATASMHGGFVLYNGGFTAGLTALVLLPVLDFYKLEPKYQDDTE